LYFNLLFNDTSSLKILEGKFFKGKIEKGPATKIPKKSQKTFIAKKYFPKYD
jgi:hypothetical protein